MVRFGKVFGWLNFGRQRQKRLLIEEVVNDNCRFVFLMTYLHTYTYIYIYAR